MPTEKNFISSIETEGFKSLANRVHLPIRPLTLIAGANSSGKSSVFQPLLLLKQTLEATFDPGPLLLNGPNTKFTSSNQLFSNIPGEEKDEKFCIKVNVNSGSYIESSFRFSEGEGVKIDRTKFKAPAGDEYIEGDIKESSTEKDIVGILTDELIERSKNLVEDYDGDGKWVPNRDRCFMEFLLKVGNEPLMGFSPFAIKEMIQDIIHVPGLRDNPNRQYKKTAAGHRFPGTFETYVASVIDEWIDNGGENMPKLSSCLSHMGLTEEVKTRRINETQIQIRVDQQPTISEKNRFINIADVGMGVSQVLPVLVSLLVAREGQLVYVEQPEIHLHPRAQTRLADVLVEAANRGVRVVVETHSQLLLLALQARIAEDQIDPDRMMLHWFSRREDGVTEVDSQVPDEKGAFGDWPEDFSEVEMEAENRYLDAAERHLFKE